MSTIRNCLSNMRLFAGWCESEWKQSREEELLFCSGVVTILTITGYRGYFQQSLHLKPNFVSRSIMNLKRYFAWLLISGQVRYDPAKAVKLIEEKVSSPRHLNDQEKQALVATVTETGRKQVRAIIVLLLRTGLRAQEHCTLTCDYVKLVMRSGTIAVCSKYNKYRGIPLNTTACAALLANEASLRKSLHDATPLFFSEKKQTPLTVRGWGYLIEKYAVKAGVEDVCPHDILSRFGYCMANCVPLRRLAQIIAQDSLDTTMRYKGTQQDLQKVIESIAWTSQ